MCCYKCLKQCGAHVSINYYTVHFKLTVVEIGKAKELQLVAMKAVLVVSSWLCTVVFGSKNIAQWRKQDDFDIKTS